MEYQDKKTGAVIISDSELGGDWVPVKESKSKKKPKNEEV